MKRRSPFVDDEAEVQVDGDDDEEEEEEGMADYYEEEETSEDASNNDSSGVDDVKPGASGSKTTNEKKRKRDADAEASTSAVANADTTQNGERIKEVPFPLCSTAISTSLREDEENL